MQYSLEEFRSAENRATPSIRYIVLVRRSSVRSSRLSALYQVYVLTIKLSVVNMQAYLHDVARTTRIRQLK